MREFCKACNVNYQAKIGHDSGCPYCTLERLEAENARLREAIRASQNGTICPLCNSMPHNDSCPALNEEIGDD